MFIGTVQAIIVSIAFPAGMNAMAVCASEFAFVACLFGNPTKCLTLILPTGTCHIPITKPCLRNAFIFWLGQMFVRFAIEFIVRAGSIAAILDEGILYSIIFGI